MFFSLFREWIWNQNYFFRIIIETFFFGEYELRPFKKIRINKTKKHNSSKNTQDNKEKKTETERQRP